MLNETQPAIVCPGGPGVKNCIHKYKLCLLHWQLPYFSETAAKIIKLTPIVCHHHHSPASLLGFGRCRTRMVPDGVVWGSREQFQPLRFTITESPQSKLLGASVSPTLQASHCTIVPGRQQVISSVTAVFPRKLEASCFFQRRQPQWSSPSRSLTV